MLELSLSREKMMLANNRVIVYSLLKVNSLEERQTQISEGD
jgi:hypothetical protein